MNALAWRSVRHRLPTFTATFLAVFLSAAVVGSFATLVETATGPVSGTDRETLVTMGAVIGGWGALIALFSLVSTIGVAVRRRTTEIGLLRTIGATPRQVGGLVRAETAVVATLAAVAGAALAWPAGRVLLDLFRDGGMVSSSVEFAGGVTSLAVTAAATVLISLGAATLASRRATRDPVRLVLAEESTPRPLSRRRRWGAALVLAYTVGMSLVTVLVTADAEDPYAAMQTSGHLSILAGIALAAFAPAVLRRVAALLDPVLGIAGPAGHLAGVHATRRSQLMAGILGPVTVFTAAGTGVLTLAAIDGRTRVLPPDMTEVEADTITVLNNLVVGMIAVFAGLMLVNALLAVIGDRRAEFARIRLVGGTPEQVRASVLVEGLLVSATGIGLGLVASLATIVPFSLARDEGVVPDGQPWLPAAVATAAVLLTIGTGRLAARRVLGTGNPAALVAVA
jgi:putative ABC transport system permease protein